MMMYHIKQQALYSEKNEQYEQLQQEMSALKKEEKGLEQEIELLNNEEYVSADCKDELFLFKRRRNHL